MLNSAGRMRGINSYVMKPNRNDEMMDALAGGAPEVALAKGVLTQAKQDLRRYRGAPDPIGREMYRDAFSWVASNDSEWPYSFLNVCEALDLRPDGLREKLLAETRPGWYARSRQLALKLSTPFRGSLPSVSLSRSSVANTRRSGEPVLAH
jgi:hypothetical protein